DPIPLGKSGAEVAEVHAGDPRLAHVLAELEEALPPVQAGVEQDLVAAVAPRHVLAGVREEVRVIGQRRARVPKDEGEDDELHVAPATLPEPRDAGTGEHADNDDE